MSQPTDARLRALFRDAPAAAEPREPVDPDKVWLAVRGQLPRDELDALIDRCAEDPDAALAWRLAADLAADRDHTELAPVPAPANDPRFGFGVPRRLWAPVALMVAAVLLLLLAPPLLREEPTPGPTLRSGDARLALVPVQGAERGRDLVLEWSALPEGTRYTLLITDPGLAPLHRVDGLGTARATVPGAITRGWVADRVLWRVEAVTPDGRPVASEVGTIALR